MVIKKDPHDGMVITSVVNKTIMSQIRSGDYQHPGEEEAIEKMFRYIGKNKDNLLLDVGCGYGGTAAYLYKNGWGKVVGIDINQDVLNIAKEKYGSQIGGDVFKALNLSPIFVCGDVVDIEQKFNTLFNKELLFDVVYLFNSFFLFPEQDESLKILRKIANKTSKLLIFDYVNYGNYSKDSYLENGKAFLPNVINFTEIEDKLYASGWKVSEIQCLDQDYIDWYKQLINKINEAQITIEEQYGKIAFNCFLERYQHILTSLNNGLLGGAIITAFAI